MSKYLFYFIFLLILLLSYGCGDSSGNEESQSLPPSSTDTDTTADDIYNKSNGDNHGSTGKMDYNGYTYNVIRIDDRWWTAENLRTTSYNDGSPIPKWTSGSGPSTHAYSDSQNTIKYGYLYNEYASYSDKIAPIGWHVATTYDWSALQRDVDPSNGGGNCAPCREKLLDEEQGGSNDVGFSALLGGYRNESGNQSTTWTVFTSKYEGRRAWIIKSSDVQEAVFSETVGMFIRLVQD